MKESNFIKIIKRKLNFYNHYRIETTTMNGFPDLLCIGSNMDTILIEVKVAKGFKVSLSPHQISMNIKLWNEGNKANYFIVLSDKQALGIPSECPILYEGLKAKHLALNGVNEPPTAYTWPTICRYLQTKHETRTEKPQKSANYKVR